MKSFVLSCLILLSFSSCLVVKIYESPATQDTVQSKPSEVHHSMIPSGKVIEFGKQGKSEVLFFGKDQSPKKVFLSQTASLQVRLHGLKRSLNNIFLFQVQMKKNP